jgi:hypothetical protein
MDRKEAVSIASMILLLVIGLLVWEFFEILQTRYDTRFSKSDTNSFLGAGARIVLWSFIGLLAIGIVVIGKRVRRLSTRSLLITTALAAILCWLFGLARTVTN